MATSASRATPGSRPGTPDTDAPKQTAQDLAADVAKLREDLAKLASQMSTLGKQSLNTAKHAAAEGVDQLRSQGEATMAGLRTNARDVEQQLSETVREKPMTSLAIAAGIGFLFALMTRR
jgi:ElaB/YqjD/DUF883 family membrane-anchored ribosome-binding protein